MKPLFIPLKTEPFEAFADGSKGDELRRYGPRWNEQTCTVGREVVLSHGYGRSRRLRGRIWKFKRQHGSLFGSTYKAAILKHYGTLDVEIAVISITDLSRERRPCACGFYDDSRPHSRVGGGRCNQLREDSDDE